MSELKPARKPSIDHIERLVRRELQERGWSDRAIDDFLSLKFMQPITKGIVTPKAAEMMAYTLGTSVEFWTNLGKYNE